MTRYHMKMDIRGVLLNWTNKEHGNLFKHDDGRPMTPREAKWALMDELAKGRNFLPMGECDGFDYKTGCPGHRIPDEVKP